MERILLFVIMRGSYGILEEFKFMINGSGLIWSSMRSIGDGMVKRRGNVLLV